MGYTYLDFVEFVDNLLNNENNQIIDDTIVVVGIPTGRRPRSKQPQQDHAKKEKHQHKPPKQQ